MSVLRTWLILLLFVGMALVMHGIYEEKLRALKRDVRVEYRFIPRTFYEEQLASAEGGVSQKFRSMFEDADPGLRSG